MKDPLRSAQTELASASRLLEEIPPQVVLGIHDETYRVPDSVLEAAKINTRRRTEALVLAEHCVSAAIRQIEKTYLANGHIANTLYRWKAAPSRLKLVQSHQLTKAIFWLSLHRYNPKYGAWLLGKRLHPGA